MYSIKLVFRAFLLLAMLFIPAVLHGQNYAQAELRFTTTSSAEKSAGVWIDGHYMGYVKELKGAMKVLLLPGSHEIVVRQAWYKDHVEQVLFEPGKVYNMKLTMVKDPRTPSTNATAELKISATPGRAAVFVDDQFAGYSGEFDGTGRAMLITPGQHKLSVALPGYLPFETVLNLYPHQKLKIQTALSKGSITEAGSLVSHE
jgi:PEGA domain-containing protein